jgi:hypothetical protein
MNRVLPILSAQIATDLLEDKPAANARLPINTRGYGHDHGSESIEEHMMISER